MALFLTIYVGKDCPECEEAIERLRRLGPELKLQIKPVDITGRKDLEEKWLELIPAGVLLGKIVFKYKLDEPGLRRRVKMLTRGKMGG
jgi:hypothetical protein